MLRVVPQSNEELQKVQELQELEHLQVLGVEVDLGTPLSPWASFYTPKQIKDGVGCGIMGTKW